MKFSPGILVIARVFQTESVPLKSFNKLTCEIKYCTGLQFATCADILVKVLH